MIGSMLKKISITIIFLLIYILTFSGSGSGSGSNLNSSATANITALMAEAPPEIRVIDPNITGTFIRGQQEARNGVIKMIVTSFDFKEGDRTNLYVRYPQHFSTSNATGDQIYIRLYPITGETSTTEGNNFKVTLDMIGSAVRQNFELPYVITHDGFVPIGTYTGSFSISVNYE